ncbi:MAG: hypothetical protein EBX63_10180, partial [Betaproteobacteria bacterium]|nr:hypothetical protein [Betaproteobacteria bacterium]
HKVCVRGHEGKVHQTKSRLQLHKSLLRSAVIVRPVTNYGLAQWLRVSVGLPQENDAFLKALANALDIEWPLPAARLQQQASA